MRRRNPPEIVRNPLIPQHATPERHRHFPCSGEVPQIAVSMTAKDSVEPLPL
jgi:hypothetical protein